ncbi:MAG: hypothetical protein AAF721_17365 [Myxococcota bacterium]
MALPPPQNAAAAELITGAGLNFNARRPIQAMTPVKGPLIAVNTVASQTLVFAVALGGLMGCGLEGKRFGVCDQAGAICDVLGTDTGEDPGAPERDTERAGDGTGTTGAADDTLGDASTGGSEGTGFDETASDEGGSDDTGDTEPELTEPPPGFDAPQPFGDSVLETDLIGTWTLPAGGAVVGHSMVLDITAEGRFRWREYDDACALSQAGAGWIWVEGSQLVFLVGNWIGPAPWPVAAKYGWTAEAPFLIRAGYAPILGHIGLFAPPAIREAQPWAGRGFVRSVGGATAQDIWISETELWAVAPEAEAADIVVRDRSTLDMSTVGIAESTFRRWWFQDGQIDGDIPVSGQLGTIDDGVGNVLVGGAHHVYVGNGMATFAAGDVFALGGEILCE